MVLIRNNTSHNIGGCNFCGRTDFHNVREVQGISLSVRFCLSCAEEIGKNFAKLQENVQK